MRRSPASAAESREFLASPGRRSRTWRGGSLLRRTSKPLVARAFLAEFERVRDLLVENQYRGPHGEYGLRLYHLDRFPYTVVYEPDEQTGPQIYAVAHQHREPGYWAKRIDP
ncbi:MAG: type II toxin-antitoxin system RelE/ParE family toxin [Xanthomonadales bacterium]|nr:type II toxin-antitoxin system RelE/ParE family toxin [Xanthomonadales bacterium]